MWVVLAARGFQKPGFESLSFFNQFPLKKQFRNVNNFAKNISGKRYGDDLFFDTLNKNHDIKSRRINWDIVKQSLVQSKFANEVNVDSVILNNLNKSSSYEMVDEYVEYLKSSKIKLNLGVIGSILKCYAQKSKDKIETAQATVIEQFILELYKELISTYKVLDKGTLENCICALSHTSKWKECLSLYEKVKLMETPVTKSYISIIVASFENNEPDLGWKFLREMVNYGKIPDDYACLACINYYVKRNKNNFEETISSLEKFIYFTVENNILLDKIVVENIANVFKTCYGWTSKTIKIDEKGQCPKCKMHLSHFSLTSDEHQKLKNAFYKLVLVKKNIYMNSTPKELDDYMSFIENNAPFDIVIDGLNVAYSTSNNSSTVGIKILTDIIKTFKNMGKTKILVLGRKHMNRWAAQELNFIKKNAMYFFVNDMSYDDTFLLYAALCGENTDFMSRDLMRGHKFKLGDDKHLFEKWQHVHQYSLFQSHFNGKVTIKEPLRYLILPQKQTNWHIPFAVNDTRIENFNNLHQWICLQPKNIKSTVEK